MTITAANGAAQFPTMTPVITVGGAGVSSPPVITFSIGDGNGTAYAGFDKITNKSSTATVASYPNLAFSIAKLVPGVNGAPSKWVSYIITTVPTTTAAATPTRPTTDNTGTLEYLGQGIYRYTFYRDITKIKDQVAAMPNPAAPADKAQLGDLTYDPNALHRITIQFAGTAPGTGTNTPTGADSGVPAVALAKPLNVFYDFIPATGKQVLPTDTTVKQRLIVDKASCNDCHAKLGGIPGTESASFHGGSRYDPQYCVVCHTDQRKYGRANVASTNNAFPAGSSTYIADGVTIGDFPVLIHEVHKGEELVKQNYNYAGVLLNETKFPQDIRNCTSCHDNTPPKVAPQGTNYQTVPSRLACGACHDGINWATGRGETNNGGSIGHIGGPQTDDSKCALCHDANSIKSVYHVPVTPPNPNNALLVAGGPTTTNAAWVAGNPKNLPAGAVKVTYDVASVSRNASKQPVIVFKILLDGTARAFNDPKTKTEIYDNFFGAPSVYFVWSVPQDGIAAPSDYNVSASGWIKSIWNGKATGNGAGTLSGPDANGYYTITLTGVQVPDNAVMFSGGVGYTYSLGSSPPLTQIGVVDPLQSNQALGTTRYGVSNSTVVTGTENKIGGLIVVAPDVQKTATGFGARRQIVDDALCNKCHLELGLFTAEAFHAGQRNDGSTCAWCHRPAQTSSGWSADSSYFVHAVHAADKRTVPFTWHAAEVGKSYADIGYPGILNKCEACHLPGTYDFSASASQSAMANRLYVTVGVGKYNAGASALAKYTISPYVTADNVQNYGAGFVFNQSATANVTVTKADGTTVTVPPQGTFNAEGTTLVMSPIVAVCSSCHDATVAIQHMESNGGSFYRARSVALARSEQCMFCHSPDSAFGLGIKAVHAVP